MDFMTPEMMTALMVFIAVVAAQLCKGAVRMITAFVKSTPTTLDDKIWAAVVEGVQDALKPQEVEVEQSMKPKK